MKTITATVLMLSMTVGAAAHADGHDRGHGPERGEHHEHRYEPSRGPQHWDRQPHRDSQHHDYSSRNWNDRGGHHDWPEHAPPRPPTHWAPERHDYNAHNWSDRGGRHDWPEHAAPHGFDHWRGGPDHWGYDFRAYEFHPQHRYYVDRYYRPYGYAPRVWRHGDYLPAAYCAPRYVVDYRPYRLSPPPYGYHWVRVDHDIFLAAITTGLVVSAVYGIFG